MGAAKSGKSSIIGKLLYDSGYIDKEEFEKYVICYRALFPDQKNLPYDWLSNLSNDEKRKCMTSFLNSSSLNTEDKFITIFDTPSREKKIRKYSFRFVFSPPDCIMYISKRLRI